MFYLSASYPPSCCYIVMIHRPGDCCRSATPWSNASSRSMPGMASLGRCASRLSVTYSFFFYAVLLLWFLQSRCWSSPCHVKHLVVYNKSPFKHYKQFATLRTYYSTRLLYTNRSFLVFVDPTSEQDEYAIGKFT